MLRALPAEFLLWVGASVASLLFVRWLRFRLPEKFFYPGIAMFLAASIVLATGLWVLWRASAFEAKSRRRWLVSVSAALVVMVMLFSWIRHPGANPFPEEQVITSLDVSGVVSTLPSPAEPGEYEWSYFTYGSGDDQRRSEFAEGVSFRSESVDLSKILPEWKGFKKRAREWFWGFSIDAAPMNGRVWMPEGDGPFPLAVIIHGNHGMEDFSDAGYGYLGELLASRGVILVSIDENYINGSWSGDFRGREMPARAIIVLEHLKQWREWTRDPDHPMHAKADMDRIAVMGHSRGGEAAPIVGSFNRLRHFPDDASFEFDYGFGIRSLVAIAPVDQRYHRRVHVHDVSFLTIQGSYDSDEPAFHGLRQMRRNHFTEPGNWFEAGVYVHRANHGQFNTTWGRRDSGPPNSWLLNLEPILPPEDQRLVAKIYVSAFVEATLLDNDEYLPLFRDPRFGAEWLPPVTLIAQYDDSSFQPIAAFDEDLDVTTASVSGGSIRAEHFTLWREDDVRLRDNLRQGTHAVVLGWDRTGDEVPTYSVFLPDGFLAGGDVSVLSFTLSPSTESPRPDDGASGGDESDVGSDTDEEDEGSESTEPLDFSLELVDARGERAKTTLSAFAAPTPPLQVRFLKDEELNQQRYRRSWEPTPQYVEIAFDRIAGASPSFDPRALREIHLLFDRGASSGVVILDDLGLRAASGWNLPSGSAGPDAVSVPTDRDDPSTGR